VNKLNSPVAYIDKTRLFYEAQGFEAAYQYAANQETPFQSLPKPLSQSRLGVVTTASRYFREDLEPRKVDYGETSVIPERLFADDLSWDKEATHLRDVNSFLPLETLHKLNEEGVFGSLSSQFVCAPTEYSQRATREQDAPEILSALQADEVDVALLIPL
jgi:hypothetical protein